MAIKLEDPYKCYIHDFSGSPADGRKHTAEVSHSFSGSQACSDCGAPNIEHDYEGVLHESKYPVTPTRCDVCYEKLRKQFAEDAKA
jgi:hypothetical protein